MKEIDQSPGRRGKIDRVGQLGVPGMNQKKRKSPFVSHQREEKEPGGGGEEETPTYSGSQAMRSVES